ncbi:MAG: SPASM domain-containing protein [Treponema sp.]|nr:SPASM domain-containing protein [Treponema sp.]
MHSYNADDFTEMIKLAEKFDVKGLAILVFKPDSTHHLTSIPTYEQMQAIRSIIKNYDGPVSIGVESCYSPLKAMLGHTFFMNTNRGILKGCGAGRDGISVSVDGKLTPCRHIEIEENYTSIASYWNESPTLAQLRSVEDSPESNCKTCKYKEYCIPCCAVGIKMKGRIVMDSTACVVPQD